MPKTKTSSAKAGRSRGRRMVSLDQISEILRSTDKITQFRDLDAILDTCLHEARRLASCDAGSIYLRDGENLVFGYVQNDTFFHESSVHNKYLYYQHSAIPINESSIAGYVAMTGRPLRIADVYRLPPDAPYRFNNSFDLKTGYRTVSILAVPLRIHEGEIIGVMQLINAMTPEGKVRSFTEVEEALVPYFANIAAFAIERGKQIREMILRMVRLSELRDPHETGQHVQRVGNYAIEIYEAWARRRGVDAEYRRRYKDCLKIAAMLHDVGKVAISDTILKKPGKLDEAEYRTMKAHTIFGARLFVTELDRKIVSGDFMDLDPWCAEVALDHHERWDGMGYPGHTDLFRDPPQLGPGKRGEEISLTGRIVALADVYDALISKRVYKDAWTENDVLHYIRDQSGKQFDPEVVECFLSIYEVIQAIREKFPDQAA